MPILDIPHGLRRVGKLRLGIEVETGNGKTRPSKLDTFRFTSGDEQVIAAVAAAYGGQPRPWDNDGAAEFEVVTDAAALDVLITPEADSFSQWNELWKAGGCQRRCDGQVEQLSGLACQCPADHVERKELAVKGQACKPTTRVSVVLPRVPALGAWMVESHGYYAARELGSTFALLNMAGARRGLLPARLRIEQRTAKRDGKTNRYGVPVLDIGMRFDELMGTALPAFDPATGEITEGQAALPAAEPVTSTKKAAARKEAAAKKPAPVDDGPMSDADVAAVKARVAVMDSKHQAECATLMNNARVTLKTGPPQRSQASTIETVLAAVEAKQAEAWEGRRQRVFAALEPFGFDAEQRHRFIADATSGATESTKTLTEEQAGLIITCAVGDEQQLPVSNLPVPADQARRIEPGELEDAS